MFIQKKQSVLNFPPRTQDDSIYVNGHGIRWSVNDKHYISMIWKYLIWTNISLQTWDFNNWKIFDIDQYFFYQWRGLDKKLRKAYRIWLVISIGNGFAFLIMQSARRVVFWNDANGSTFVLSPVGSAGLEKHPLVVEDCTVTDNHKTSTVATYQSEWCGGILKMKTDLFLILNTFNRLFMRVQNGTIGLVRIIIVL